MTFRCGHPKTPENTYRWEGRERAFETCRQCKRAAMKRHNRTEKRRISNERYRNTPSGQVVHYLASIKFNAKRRAA